MVGQRWVRAHLEQPAPAGSGRMCVGMYVGLRPCIVIDSTAHSSDTIYACLGRKTVPHANLVPYCTSAHRHTCTHKRGRVPSSLLVVVVQFAFGLQFLEPVQLLSFLVVCMPCCILFVHSEPPASTHTHMAWSYMCISHVYLAATQQGTPTLFYHPVAAWSGSSSMAMIWQTRQ